MVFDTIELKDADYGSVKKSSKIRKIKFKSLSFKNISNLWKNFRISCLNKRLESAKDNLVSMEIKNQDFNEKTLKGDMSVAEKKLLRKTTAIARLESRIEFLRTGTEVTDDFISSRAIKLKDNMMKNLRYNCNSAYSILPEDADKIFAEEDSVEKIISDTQRKVAESVQRMMDEKKAAVTTEPVTNQKTEAVTEPKVSITAPSQKEMSDLVDKMFEEQEQQVHQTTESADTQSVDTTKTVSKEEITAAVADEYSEIDVTPSISETETEETVNEELNRLKISKNESSAAKVNKFVNEDGTYRMKRDDIDEDFRKTKIDRRENPQTIEKIDVSKFVRDENNNPRTMVDMMRKALESAGFEVQDIREVPENEVITENIVTTEPPRKAPEDVVREVPQIAPQRETTSVRQQVQDLSAAVDEAKTMEDVKAIMASVAQLEQQREQYQNKAAAVAEDSEKLKAEKAKEIQKLLSYHEALQADVDASSRQVEEQEAANAAMADEIQAIRGAMSGRR